MLAALLTLMLVVPGPVAAATIDEILAPAELDASAAFRDVTSSETFVVEGGIHTGHTALRQPVPAHAKSSVPYALQYNVCLDREAHPNLQDVWPREGGLGIGMLRPTFANWYGGGFIDLLVNGVSLGARKAAVAVAESGDAQTVRFSWDTPDALAQLDFTTMTGHEYMLVSGTVQPRRPLTSLEVTLDCYPSSFSQPRDRWVATAAREAEHGQALTLTSGECWVLCADRYFDEAARPAESQGPAAVLFSPAEIGRARVDVGEYRVRISLQPRGRANGFRVAIWEFPNVANDLALTQMRALLDQDPVAGAAVLTENVPPRTLTLDGRPTAEIIIPAQATPQERRAAQEFLDGIADMSGALLPIRTDDTTSAANRVFIGATSQAVKAGLQMEPAPDEEAGFRIKTVGKDVFITAEHPTAAIYGACELLEKLGMRWFLPGPLGTVTPQIETISLPEIDEVQRPSFPMRWVGTGDWGLRNKCNRSIGGEPGDAWGFNVRPGIYHSDYKLLPVAEYYDKHPEYFALVSGERCSDPDTKLCVSNPEVVAEVARNMGKLLDEDPSIDLIGLAPTDGTNYCECPDCCAMDETEERPADRKYSRRMLLFYNAVARQLARTHPDAQILAGAYHWYNQPPADDALKAEPNLSLVICHYTEYCSMHEVQRANCPPNNRYSQLLDSWRALIPDIYFYEYYYTDGFRQLPCNLVPAISRDMTFYHQQGFKGVYTQYGNIWNTCLNYYIAAKLLWDVDADVEALLADFYKQFFGPAAAPMAAYFELIASTLDTTDQHLCTCSGVGRDMRTIFSPEVVAEMRRHYDDALALAEDPMVRARLAKVGAAVDYTERFMDYLDDHYAALGAADPAARKQAADRALERIEGLYEEVKSDPGKWDGVVSPGSYHWRSDLGAARRLAARTLAAAPPGALGTLPEQWKFATDPDNGGVEAGWSEPGFDDASWEDISVTRHWEMQGHEGYDGYAWYRTDLVLTAGQVAEPLALYFPGVDAEAWVYLEGRLIGHHEGWDEPFTIAIPEDLAVTGRTLSLAVRVFDSSANGGLYGTVRLVRGN